MVKRIKKNLVFSDTYIKNITDNSRVALIPIRKPDGYSIEKVKLA